MLLSGKIELLVYKYCGTKWLQ